MIKIFTIGYEGATIGDFVSTLKEAKVDILMDIREMPLSRKAGFSKTALSMLITCAGLEYHHVKQLGAPKNVRENLKASGDWKQYFKEFDEYLDTQNEFLMKLSSDITGNIALMCFERDPQHCHRSSVAREMGKILGVTPVHLGVKKYAHQAASQDMYFGKSTSTA